MTVNECKDMFPSPYTPNQWYTMEHKGQKFQAMRNQQGFVHVRKVITLRDDGHETLAAN